MFGAACWPQARAADRLSEDAFEGLMDHFAKALQAALQQRAELWPAAVGQAFEAADIDRILPLEQALQTEVGVVMSSSWQWEHAAAASVEAAAAYCGACWAC